ncbi:transglutaminase-like domain-containing protein [Agromyces cerinus]|uniref:Transglutaminase-like superfamily protein n=1 Tax=Agromyces cerinus subsp. cerinus TaxID=232089 RepID=A0A1N6HF48_9MICO|nr:transglutaminase-like domain-containing protein [Agromyces cerinus]SIO18235.1 Transglutaminase-like superfamily protein [Agromyces cerinus subsp. cerinus]
MTARVPAGARRFGPTLVTVVLVVAMLAAAMLPWWPVYESPAFLVAAAVAIVAGVAIGVIGARFRLPSWIIVLSVFAAYLVLGVPAAVPGAAIGGILPTPSGIVELLAGAALSWKQLVTISVPVGSYQALLVPPFLLGLVAATAAISIALRSRRPAAAALPPAVLLVAGIALGVVHSALAVEAGIAYLITAIAWLVRVAIADRRAITSGRRVEAALTDARRVLGASALVAIAVVGATAASVALPVPPRNVVRAELQPPFEPRQHDSPLAGFRAAFGEDVADDVMLDVRGLPEGAGLRMAALDSYDGIVYTVGGADAAAASGRFTRVPYRLDQSGVSGDNEPAAIEVEVEGYAEVWVPGVGRLERMTFGGPRAELLTESFFYNEVTSTGAVQRPLQSGDRFAAISVVPVAPEALAELSPGTSVLPAAPEMPEELAQLLDEWASSSDEPGVRLQAVIEGFHANGYVSHGYGEVPSRSGHSLDRLADLAVERPMVGDGEQYAVAAALMARHIGFPARVVVGYLPGGAEAAAAVADGTQESDEPDAESDPAPDGVTRFVSGDKQAWIEVQRADGAWIAVDPNPMPSPIPEREPDQPTIVSRPQSALPPPAERTPVDDLANDPETPPDEPDDRADAWVQTLLAVLGVAGIVLGVLAVIASPFLAIIVAKMRRRRLRRKAPSAVERIEGGWQEFADSAADYGYPIRPMSTRAEQAATVGGLAPLVLASVVDRAVFAPDGPAEGDDRLVWDSVDELQERLGAPRSLRERLRAAVSLTSLGGYAVTRRGGRS